MAVARLLLTVASELLTPDQLLRIADELDP
jgi:hypothetical protein